MARIPNEQLERLKAEVSMERLVTGSVPSSTGECSGQRRSRIVESR